MTFNPIQNTSSFSFHIENIDDPDQREASIRWGKRTITISSPVLDQTNKTMSYMYEHGTTDTDNLIPLELEEGNTVYLDLTQITQDEKGTRNHEELRIFADKIINQIELERDLLKRNPLKSELESWVNDPDITTDQKTKRQEAQRRILKCQMEQSTDLDLSCFAFTTLPEYIGQLTQLTTLDLHNNPALKSLPDSIGQLTHLTTLDLSYNGFTTLPECVGQLTQLTTLHLYGNQLEALPESIGQLTKLQTLYLFHCPKLKSLPDSIGQLTQLTTLYIYANQLESLPESIGQLTQLTDLHLSDNQLTSIPEWIGQLTELTTLDLSGCRFGLDNNQLTSIPETIGQLTKLTVLNLSRNRLTSIPTTLGQLTQLRHLYLSNNQLTSLPASLGRLTRLERLDLDKNKLTSLPGNFGQLTKLTDLYLDKNKLTSIPASLGRLTRLERLDLGNNQLTSIPETIGQLTKLTELNLGGNQLTSLPESIEQLTQLHTLYLHNNQLQTLPESFGQLKQLIYLNLNTNTLTSLPESFGQLTQLPELNLGGNQLTSLPESIEQLTQLHTLYLHNNQLQTLHNSIGQLPLLTELNMGNNNLRSLPLSILDLPNMCYIDLEGHAFSNEVLANLRAAIDERGENCPTIQFDMPTPRDASNPPPVEESFQKLFTFAGREMADISFFQGEGKPYALWLNHLLQTSDFTRGPEKAKDVLANIVLNCFEYAASNPDFFDAFANFSFENFIQFSTESCVDRLTLSLNDLEVFVGLHKMLKEQPSEAQTIQILKNVWAAYLLNQIAAEKYKTLRLRDEIEVHLAYLTQCKEGLEEQGIKLPFTSSGMMFLDYSGVNPEEIAVATTTVTTQFNNHRAFVDFLFIEDDLKSKACFSIFENMKTSWEKSSDDFKKIVKRQEAIEDDEELNGGQVIAAYDAIAEEKRGFYTEKIDAILNA